MIRFNAEHVITSLWFTNKMSVAVEEPDLEMLIKELVREYGISKIGRLAGEAYQKLEKEKNSEE